MTNYRFLLLCLCFFMPAPQLLAAGPDNMAQARAAITNKDFATAENLLSLWLADNPADDEARFLLARTLAWSGKHKKSLLIYDQLLGRSPRNVDYLLGKAQVLVWDKRELQALPLLENARTMAPDYEAIWKLEIATLRAMPQEAGRLQDLLASAGKRFPGATWLTQEPAAPAATTASRTELELSTGVQGLSGERDNWRQHILNLSHTTRDRQTFYASLRSIERYRLQDREISLGMYTPMNNSWALLLEALRSNTNHISPRNYWLLQLEKAFKPGGLVWQGGIKQSSYRLTDSRQLQFTLQHYWPRFMAGYSASAVEVEGPGMPKDVNYTHKAEGIFFHGTGSQTGISLAGGKEVEYDGTDTPPLSDILTLTLSGKQWMNDKWALTYSIEYHEQGDIYHSRGLLLGLRHRL